MAGKCAPSFLKACSLRRDESWRVPARGYLLVTAKAVSRKLRHTDF
jgi:hypothetical protein